MDFSCSDEQNELRELARKILSDLATNERLKDVEARTPVFDKDLWRELGNLPMLSDSLTVSSHVCAGLGEYDQAVAFSEEAFQISQSINNLYGQSYSRDMVGYVHWERGQPDRFRYSLMTEAERLTLWTELEKYSYGVGL